MEKDCVDWSLLSVQHRRCVYIELFTMAHQAKASRRTDVKLYSVNSNATPLLN